MSRGVTRPDRKVFPVRQDVDGDEVDRLVDFAVLQPVFPDVGVGHGNTRDLRLHQANIGGEVGGRHLAPQQHFIADNDG